MWFGLLLGCADEAPERAARPTPESIVGGCVDVIDGKCILERPTSITVWLDTPGSTPLRVRADGVSVAAVGREVQGGTRLHVDVPDDARRIEVDSAAHRWDPRVVVEVEWRPPPDTDDLDREALRSLADHSSGWEKLRALDLLRRGLGATGEASSIAREALGVARELGATKHQALILSQLTHAQIEYQHDLEGARATLRELESLASSSAFARARFAYYDALHARRSGYLGTALNGFTNAHREAERVNFGIPDVVELLSNTLAELGRVDEALPLLRAQEERLWQSEGRCQDWVGAANNLAWGQIVLGASGHEHDDPRPLVRAALQKLKACPDHWVEAALRLDLALAEQEYGNPLEAQRALSLADSVPSSLQGWLDVARVSIALQRGDDDSLPSLLRQPQPTDDFELAWNQHVQHGDLLARWGFYKLAAESYAFAEEQLNATFENVGADGGGELYVAGRSASLEGLVDASLELGDVRRAACAIRLARAREFARLDRIARLGVATSAERSAWESELSAVGAAQLEASTDRSNLWKLSAEERTSEERALDERDREHRERLDRAVRRLGLSPRPRTCSDLRTPTAGEVLVISFRDRVFAMTISHAEVADRADLSSLAPLADASKLTIIDAMSEDDEPLHLAPWRGSKSLMDLAPTSYSLDLPPRDAPARLERIALVLADPQSDLPHARVEASDVASTLTRAGWSVTELHGDAVTRTAVVERLGSASLLHYSGHGLLRGRAGWDSALMLANDDPLGIHDIFALPRAPVGVVLTGCDTAGTSPQIVGGGMNIARAFVLAGSQWVIAADSEVPDETAARMGRAVHRATGDSGPARLRAALQQLRAESPELEWGQFRAVTP